MKAISKLVPGNIEFGEIDFRYLYQLHDWDGIILRGLILEDDQVLDLINMIKDLSVKDNVDPNKVIKFMPIEKHVTGIYFINDNIKGSDGQSNWLMTCDHPELQFNSLIRLIYQKNFTWIEDFKSNCHDWYLSGLCGPSTPKSDVLKGKIDLLKSGDKRYSMR